MKKGISTKAPRTCRECGGVFDGGPRAWYCPECREERRKIQKERYERRRKMGLSIVLGESVGRCAVCGKAFVYASARQWYCPDCAKSAWKEADRKQGLEWYHGNNTDERRQKKSTRQKERRESRRSEKENRLGSPVLSRWEELKKINQHTCLVCGKKIPSGRRKYCSKECYVVGGSYSSTLSHYLAGDNREPPSWEDWIKQHKK